MAWTFIKPKTTSRSHANYIDKIVSHHDWENEKAASRPVPMRSNTAYQATLELAKAPKSEKEQRELEKAMGFSYRQAIGELIFALTICRPDMQSQSSSSHSKLHVQQWNTTKP